MFVNPSDAEVAERLRAARTIAIVGLSDDPGRDSDQVAAYLARAGYSIVPVNPNLEIWRGRQCFPDMASAMEAAEANGTPIDLVDVFRRATAVKGIVRELKALGLKAAWFQLGVIDWVAAAEAERCGIWTVMDRCIAVEHRRLVPK